MPKISRSHTTPEFEEKFSRLPKSIQKLVSRKVFIFENNPFHPGLHAHKLSGWLDGFWSFYVNRSYRVLFRFLKNNEVIYYDIDTHEIYK